MKNQYLCSIVEGSRIFNIGKHTLYSWARVNEIPCFVKIGCTTKIIVPKLQEYLESAARENKQL